MSGATEEVVEDPPEDDIAYVARTLKIPREEARRFLRDDRTDDARALLEEKEERGEI